MRTFVIYSQTASTSPYIKDLKGAGRWDILLHSIISGLFASNTFRDDVSIHLVLMGEPTPPRHIEIKYDKKNTISKKDLKKLVEIALRKFREGRKVEAHPGVFIDNLDIDSLVNGFEREGRNIFILDKLGEHVKNIPPNLLEHGVFILGDYDGFDKKTRKYLKKNCNRLSLGNQIYFTSQAITIINYELDNL